MTNMSNTLVLGAGCYWGTEKYIVKNFQSKFPNSIKSARVGFMSPDPDAVEHPTYRQVCSGETGHVEVLSVELTDAVEHFEEVLKFFFQFHDPTTLNRQGNDVGTQYASYIFTSDEEQKAIAQKVISELQGYVDSGKVTSYSGQKISTKVAPVTTFYEAHQEHQDYLSKNPNGYCNHYLRFKEWPLN